MRKTKTGRAGAPVGGPKRGETLASSTYERLRNDIMQGVHPPGQKLHIRELQARYSVGLSPIREALNRVSRDGLVKQTDMKGFSVAPLSEGDLDDLTRTRCWLYEIGLRQSIENGDAAWEEGVLVAYHRLSKIARYEGEDRSVVNPAWERTHRLFHASLIAACSSTWLISFCEQLFDAADRYRFLSRLVDTTPSPLEEPRIDEHRRLMEATVAREADRAVQLLQEHFKRTAQRGRLMLAQLRKHDGSVRRRKPSK
jgi:DNA-binding GntR family transcriptional regulator